MTKRNRPGSAEQRWRGVAVSEGAARGRVLRIHVGASRQIYRVTLDAGDVQRETRRFRAAVRLARRQLMAIKRRAERVLGAEHAYIFDAHILMLEDSKLREDVERFIQRERVNAEYAVKVAADQLLAVYAEFQDEYLRGRSSDIEDVASRILFALSGEQTPAPHQLGDVVIVAEELMPSVAAELDFAHIRAIATDVGGWTSHTAIIARGMGIPAVVGLRDMFRRARTGEEIVVDAWTGEVILHPSPATVELYRTTFVQPRIEAARQAEAETLPAPLCTRDGVEIILRANVEIPAEYGGVRRYGARGIGLYRSEFLLSHRGVMPSEDEQCEAYIEIAKLAGDDGATVRTFDLGGDKVTVGMPDAERNPALGKRAIRFCLQHEEILRTQTSAVLRAAAHGRLDIVLPMISDLSDVRRTRRIIDEERLRLAREGFATGEVRIGAMIEVPSAVLVADKLAREVDFFSLGTNDLVQYLLAVDRSNDEVAGWFRTLHPAVLQSIRRTLDAAREASIPAVVCGEMAATPVYAVMLVGLGARDLSMTASSIPRVRRTLSRIDSRRAAAFAVEGLECASADDVEQLVRVRFGAEWPDLFPPETLPAPKERG